MGFHPHNRLNLVQLLFFQADHEQINSFFMHRPMSYGWSKRSYTDRRLVLDCLYPLYWLLHSGQSSWLGNFNPSFQQYLKKGEFQCDSSCSLNAISKDLAFVSMMGTSIMILAVPPSFKLFGRRYLDLLLIWYDLFQAANQRYYQPWWRRRHIYYWQHYHQPSTTVGTLRISKSTQLQPLLLHHQTSYIHHRLQHFHSSKIYCCVELNISLGLNTGYPISQHS